MANEKTPYVELVKQDPDGYVDGGVLNDNMDIIDEELHKRGTTVNSKGPDENGNYQIDEVPFARQIVTTDEQESHGEFIERTTGGTANVDDGDAKLMSIFGRSLHTGVVHESIEMTVNAVPRGTSGSGTSEGDDSISAELNRDIFVAYVQQSCTITLTYTDAWSANPTLYGITIVGTPVAGDQIIIVYAKEDRGLITTSNPQKFVSTGWNLYKHTSEYSGYSGYARVLKYSTQYGFLIGGTYTALYFSATLTGAKTEVTPVSGYFTIPSDGYLWVTGGNNTNTYILMTWSDWGNGYEGTWQAYTESVINLASVMTNFPNGLMSLGGVADEINIGTNEAISRINRVAYTAENLEAVIESGQDWEADTDYIYFVRETPITYAISVTGDFVANDHGMEIIGSTTVAVYVQTLYGENLVDKLRNNVVTIDGDLSSILGWLGLCYYNNGLYIKP